MLDATTSLIHLELKYHNLQGEPTITNVNLEGEKEFTNHSSETKEIA